MTNSSYFGTRPLRILQLVSSPTTSGPCVYVMELSQTLRSMGHHITIVARPQSWLAEEATKAQFETFVSEQHRFPLDQIQYLRKLVIDRQIDVIHTHMSRAHFMGVLLRGICQVPCIATAHCRKIQAHWMLNNHVIATSLDTEQFHRRFNMVPTDRISTIYCPVPQRLGRDSNRPLYDARSIRDLRSQWGCANEGPTTETVIGVVGEISPAKGQWHLLHAIKKLSEKGRQVRLVVIGNHRKEYVWELQKLARDLGIGSKVHWAGFCDRVPVAMTAMDIYVCPSLNESLPLTILEAMAAARPVVSTSVGGIPEVIRHRETGMLVTPRDAAAIAEAIHELIDCPRLAQQIGSRAWQKVQTEFDPWQQTRKVEQLYYRFVAAKLSTDAGPQAA
ncbi:MAG: glycosyltransferase family 4 protein [Planctomycetaceae bacterium]|nr:glycosyltransferase family 4 protein [Planctomycetaceae bacterium]